MKKTNKRRNRRHWVFVGGLAAMLSIAGCTSFESVRQGADQGDPEMQYKAAMMLREGDGVKPDRKLSDRYLAKSFQARNLLAACRIVDDILADAEHDRTQDLMKAYDIIFTRQATGFNDIMQTTRVKFAYPDNVLLYTRFLMEKKYDKSAYEFKKFAMKYLDRERCNRPGRDIARCKQELQSMQTALDAAEAKRIEAEKRIAEEKRLEEEKKRQEAEEKRLASPEFKFPMRNVSDNRVALSKDYVSGISFQWFQHRQIMKLKSENDKRIAAPQMEMEKSVSRKMTPEQKRKFQAHINEKLRKKRPGQARLEEQIMQNCHEIIRNVGFDGFSYALGDAESLIFACRGPVSKENRGTAVLVAREIVMPESVSLEAAEKSIISKNQDAKAVRHKQPQSPYNTLGCTIEIQNRTTRWILKRTRDCHQRVTNAYAEQYGWVVVMTMDRNLSDTFIKMKNERVRKEKQEQQKKLQAEQKNALDQI